MLDNIPKSLVSSVNDVLSEKENKPKSGDKEAYQKFFDKAMKKFGVKSPAELEGDKEKEFYNYIDKNWKSDDEKSEDVNEEELEKDSDDPCWDGYVQLGTKKKNGKEVPNCVPKESVNEEADDEDDEDDEADEDELDEKKMSAAAKRKAAKYRQKNKQKLKKYQKKYKQQINRGSRKVDKKRSKSMRKSRKKPGIRKEELEEKAVSQAQQKLMGMAYSLKKGEMDRGEASDEVKRLADTMSVSDLKDFAGTSHDDLPLKVETTNLVKDLGQLNEKFDFRGSGRVDNPFEDFNGAITALTGLATMVLVVPTAMVTMIFSTAIAKLIILVGFAAYFVLIAGLGGISVGEIIKGIRRMLASKKITAADVKQMRKSAKEVREALLKNPKLKGYRGAITKYSNELQAAFESDDKQRVLNAMESLRGYLRSLDADAYNKSLGEDVDLNESLNNDLKDLAREIDDVDEMPASIKNALENGKLPSKDDVESIDDEWAQDALLVSLSELMGVRDVEKMYGMKVINPDAL